MSKAVSSEPEYTIKASRFFVSHSLTVSSAGVVFVDSAVMKAKRTFSFGQIGSVLISDKGVLSFQVEEEVFSIPTDVTKNADHQKAIDLLVSGVQRSAETVVPETTVSPEC